jgi:hypothetical protein
LYGQFDIVNGLSYLKLLKSDIRYHCKTVVSLNLMWQVSVNGKLKLTLYFVKHHTVRTIWRSEGTAPSILNLSTRWRISGQLHVTGLSVGKESWYPMDMRLDEPQNQSGYDCEDKNFCLFQELNPGHSSHNQSL